MWQRAFSPLNTTFSLLLFGLIGSFHSYINTFHTYDNLQDMFRSFADTENTFDFVIGECLSTSTI